jgi:adenosylcobinamide-GDP ribazoletransferase
MVGGLIGLAVAAAYAGLATVMPASLAAVLSVALGVLVTGAFHEDGLADTADAFWGGADREDILRIMKDPDHGTYGVMALVLSVVVRVAALSTLGPVVALVLLPTVHALSRGAAVVLIRVLPPASGDGLGAAHVAPGLRGQVVTGVLVTIALGLVLGWWLVPFVLVAGAGTGLVGLLARSRISGFTGDVLGAAEQVVEVLLMVLGAALASNGLIETVWWS